MASDKIQSSLGYGLGLRASHYDEILQTHPPVDWFEILSENYLIAGGKPLYYLDCMRERYPIVMHGVSLSIGSTNALNLDYLQALKNLALRVKPRWISDHLCWTGVGEVNSHDLLPLPYTEESLRHVADRVCAVQDFLGQRILLENVSSYISYKQSEMSEWEFIAALAEKADCLLLLDINNVYVSSVNHRFDPHIYIDCIPLDRVQQFHIAGHRNCGTHIIDTHDEAVAPAVWGLYAYACRRFGAVSTMIERDDHIPPLPELMQELAYARHIANQSLAERRVA